METNVSGFFVEKRQHVHSFEITCARDITAHAFCVSIWAEHDRESEREQAHWLKWHSLRDGPNLCIHRQVVARQTAEAKGEIKLEQLDLLATASICI